MVSDQIVLMSHLMVIFENIYFYTIKSKCHLPSEGTNLLQKFPEVDITTKGGRSDQVTVFLKTLLIFLSCRNFAASICNKLAEMIKGLATPVELKLKLMTIFEHMHHDAAIAAKVSLPADNIKPL